MKKYISLLSLIAIFFVGMQQTQAQDSRVAESERPEAIAKKQTYELHQLVELTGDQQVETFKVLVDLAYNEKGLEGNNDIATVQKAKSTLLEAANTKLRQILTPSQYEAYQKSLKESYKEKK
ncbi:hypothetical protein Q4512_04095 [Oceanihabitans sp. 2_MG-2023]|uniref:hypothetical protein n=1 Tax=Oceanihabitans sp. 2_MG-2023 TaxID=3062661 RepID=UPI0026E2613A|nr:hypothetical protein [Oceanihabitans sp. 2_MG-2023]MDO6596083.1 hypothetical protein [Oceanihabitans sp. 2_MG-2023]